MKVTKRQLKRIIKKEKAQLLREQYGAGPAGQVCDHHKTSEARSEMKNIAWLERPS